MVFSFVKSLAQCNFYFLFPIYWMISINPILFPLLHWYSLYWNFWLTRIYLKVCLDSEELRNQSSRLSSLCYGQSFTELRLVWDKLLITLILFVFNFVMFDRWLTGGDWSLCISWSQEWALLTHTPLITRSPNFGLHTWTCSGLGFSQTEYKEYLLL